MNKCLKFLLYSFFILFTFFYVNASQFYKSDKKELSTNVEGITYEYDRFDRVIAKNYATGRKIHYKYDCIGNFTQVIDDDKITYYEYDIFGNVSKVIFPNTDSLQYLYDAFGKLLKMTYPDHSEVFYSYDLSDRLT